jgi:hypothetical protein
MPKPTNAVKATQPAVEETIDTTATDTPDTAEDSQDVAREASTKERQPSLPLSQTQLGLITKTMRQMRKGQIAGQVTPSAVAAHLKTLPEFADIADRITPVKVSSTINTMRKQREKFIESGQLPATAPEVPEFDRQHSARLAPEEFAALLAED